MDTEENSYGPSSIDPERSVVNETPQEAEPEGSESFFATDNHTESVAVGFKGTEENVVESQSQSLLADMTESENFEDIIGSKGSSSEDRVESQSQSLLSGITESESFLKSSVNTNNSEDLFRSVDETVGSTKDQEMTETEPEEIAESNSLSEEIEDMDQDGNVTNNTTDPETVGELSEHAQDQEELGSLQDDHVQEKLEISANEEMEEVDDMDEDGADVDSQDDEDNDENTVGAIQLPVHRIRKLMRICLSTNEEEDSPPIENAPKEQGKRKFGRGKGKNAKINAVGGSTNNMVVAKEAMYLAAAATELFIASVTQQSSRITTSTKKKTVTVEHLKRALSDSESYEFLQGCFQPSIIIGD